MTVYLLVIDTAYGEQVENVYSTYELAEEAGKKETDYAWLIHDFVVQG